MSLAARTRAATSAGGDGDQKGAPAGHRPSQALSKAELIDLFRELHLVRHYHDKQIEVLKAGVMPGSLHPGYGQEAIAVGVPHALRPTDYIMGTHRSNNGMLIVRGVSLHKLWAECFGRETGINHGRRGVDLLGSFDDAVRVWPENPVLGHNAGLSTGVALGLQLTKRDDVMVVLMGEGATSAGTWWESCFFAGIRRLPIVYCVENNMVAYSTPFETMTATETVAERAPAFGFTGQVVDGMDVLDVIDSLHTAVERARAGKGPTIVEFRTYRFVGHFIGDPEVYRTRQDVAKARERDPLPNFERFLRKRRILTDTLVTEIQKANEKLVAETLEQAMNDPLPDPEKCLSDTYKSGLYPMGYSS